ncbi:hypothetical protein DFH09DRAFT_1102531 [Mycena vulgaris]|nr:hypothetical protein DFH09DRAFT_1102531 [Mycena vulgaris]
MPPASASRGDSPQWKPTKRVKKQEKKERRKRKRELKKEWAMYSAPAPETCASRSASAKTWAVSGGMSEDVVKKRKDVCADEGHGLRNCGTQPPSPEHFKEVVVEREQAERIGRAEGSPERATRAYTTPQFNKVANVAAIKHAGSSLLPACTNRRASALFKKRNLAFFAMWIDPTYEIPKRRASKWEESIESGSSGGWTGGNAGVMHENGSRVFASRRIADQREGRTGLAQDHGGLLVQLWSWAEEK